MIEFLQLFCWVLGYFVVGVFLTTLILGPDVKYGNLAVVIWPIWMLLFVVMFCIALPYGLAKAVREKLKGEKHE